MGCGVPSTLPVVSKTFVEMRLEKCESCENSDGSLCLLTEQKHPGKSRIIHGVERPELRCPAPEPKWVEEPTQCPNCKRQNKIITAKDGACDRCLLRKNITGSFTKANNVSGTKTLIARKNTTSVINTSSFRATGEPQWVSLQQLSIDAHALAAMLPDDITSIVGVARSGLKAAAMVAELLHLPLAIIRQTKHDVIDAGNGWRLGGAEHIVPGGRAAIVDDTCMTGNSFKDISKLIASRFPNAIKTAVYCNPLAKVKPDIWVHELGWPHLLEWNVFNSILSPNMALDFDGILCHDCPPGSDDDGPKYLDFINNATPKYLARRTPIPLIVTARIEKYRAPTEAWLRRWKINFNKLVMHPADTLVERNKDNIAAYKAKHFEAWAKTHKAQPKPLMFLESENWQAQRISEITGRMVVCPTTGTVHHDKADTANLKYSVNPIAVTSISPHPSRLKAEKKAIQSWQKLGLRVIAIQPCEEVDFIKTQFPKIEVRSSQQVHPKFNRVLIKEMAMLSVELDAPILIINADIEIDQDPADFASSWVNVEDDVLVCGVRYNHQGSKLRAKLEPYGIDAFRLTPSMAETLPSDQWCNGIPYWDYWLPWEVTSSGYRIAIVKDRTLFHLDHEHRWEQAIHAELGPEMEKATGVSTEIIDRWIREQTKRPIGKAIHREANK